MSSPSEPGSFILRASRRVLDKLASGKELIPGLGRPGAKFEDRWPGYLITACIGLWHRVYGTRGFFTLPVALPLPGTWQIVAPALADDDAEQGWATEQPV